MMLSGGRNSTVRGDGETAAAPATHIAFLDGLRAFAALWVLIGHARLFAIGWDAQSGLLGFATNWISYMRFAVDIFIVLSGYCLTLPILRRRDRRDSIFTYFYKRARRILPPYYAAVLFCLALDAIFPFEIWARNNPPYQTQTMPAVIFFTHLFVVQDYLQQYNVINGPFWSIAVEWHIYFLFPLLMLVLRRFGRVATLLASIVLAIGLTLYSTHVHGLNSPYYILLFGMGVVSASISYNRDEISLKQVVRIGSVLLVLGAAVLAYLVVKYPILNVATVIIYGQHDPEFDITVGAITATGLALLAICGDKNVVSAPFFRFLSWRPLVRLGTFSFSVYLFHLPILTLISHFTETCFPGLDGPKRFFLYCTVGLAVILTLSYGFFLGVERPFLAKRRGETPAELSRDAALTPGV